MRTPVLVAFLAFILAACSRGCSVPAPHASTDAQSATIIDFDDVTERVWDADANSEGGVATNPTTTEKALIRKALRRARDCINKEVEVVQNHGQLPASFGMEATIRIGPGEQVNLVADSMPVRVPEALLRKMGDCLETEFRAAGIFRLTRYSSLILHWMSHFDRIGGEE
jgi:hypothetical protein